MPLLVDSVIAALKSGKQGSGIEGFLASLELENSSKGFYCSDFWCKSMAFEPVVTEMQAGKRILFLTGKIDLDLVLLATSFGGSTIGPTTWEDKRCKGESRFPAQTLALIDFCTQNNM